MHFMPIVENSFACPPHPTLAHLCLHWRSEDDTRTCAQQLAAMAATRRALITLHGDLGSGKTTFVRHLLRALGVTGRIKSPSYAVVEPHQAAHQGHTWQAWHFDFYRFNDPREWEDAGCRDLLASPGLKLVEWPEKAGDTLPCPDLSLHLSISALPASSDEDPPPARHVHLCAHTPLGLSCVQGLQQEHIAAASPASWS
jgi:tRNA threonylcarbamoyladenosine biosynthesis protein TsaE